MTGFLPREREVLEQTLQEALRRDAGDQAAEAAVRGYGPEIFGYLVRTMSDESDAAEVFSRFCEDLWAGLEGFEGRSSFRVWAYRLAVNARSRFWADPYRRRGRRLRTDEISKLEEQVRTQTLAYLKSEAKDRLARIREELEPEEQELLILRIDKKLAWNEIALVLLENAEAADEAALRRETARLRQRFKRLKEKLRSLFDQQGVSSS